MVFYSKKDSWLMIVIFAGAAVMVATGVSEIVRGHHLSGVGLLAAQFVIFALLYPLRYELGERNLLVRSGVMRWSIPLENIAEVQPSADMRSSPTYSLDRLRIVYQRNNRRRVVLISPEDQSEFLAAVEAREPALQRAGAGLTRAGRDRAVVPGS